MSKRSVFSLVPLLLLPLFFLGCGSRETAVDQGIENQVLLMNVGAEPEGLDPHMTTSVAAGDVQLALFEGLVAEDPKDLSPVPGVAESWEISEGGRVYTFHLRSDARWSNGDPVTAGDFAFSYERMLSPALGARYSYMLFVVKNGEAFYDGEVPFSEVGVKAIDDRTLRIELTEPTIYFLSLVAHNSWRPVHPATILKHGKIDQRATGWTRPENFVGNGPFKLVEWRSGRPIITVRNEHYWGAENVRLNEIHFYGMESPDTEERAFRSGQIHTTTNIPPGRVDTYKTEQPELLRSEPYMGVYYYRLNLENETLKDVRVRKALSLALDRDALIGTVMHGHVDPAYFFTPPSVAGYTSNTHVEFNPDKARELLAEAGYPNGEGFPALDLLFNTQEVHRRMAEAIQQMWRKQLNIQVGLYNQEWQVYLATVESKNYDISRAAWIADFLDPITFLDLWVTDGGNNNTGWSNQEYDDLLKQSAKTQDPTERLELFQKAEAILLDDMPVIPVYHYRSNYLVHPALQGWYGNILDIHPYQNLYFDAEKGKSAAANK